MPANRYSAIIHLSHEERLQLKEVILNVLVCGKILKLKQNSAMFHALPFVINYLHSDPPLKLSSFFGNFSVVPKEEKKELVIPLIAKNRWQGHDAQSSNEEPPVKKIKSVPKQAKQPVIEEQLNQLENEAVKEIIKGTNGIFKTKINVTFGNVSLQ